METWALIFCAKFTTPIMKEKGNFQKKGNKMKKIKTKFVVILCWISLICVYLLSAFVAALEGNKTKKISIEDFCIQTINYCHAIEKGGKYEYSF